MKRKMKKTIVGIVLASMFMSASFASFAADTSHTVNQEKAAEAKAQLMSKATEYYSNNFDWQTYAKQHPDVAAICGDNAEMYLTHWLKYGINEGRNSSDEFDALAYIIKNYDYYVENALSDSNLFDATSYMKAYGMQNKEDALLDYLVNGVIENHSSYAAVDVVKIENSNKKTEITNSMDPKNVSDKVKSDTSKSSSKNSSSSSSSSNKKKSDSSSKEEVVVTPTPTPATPTPTPTYVPTEEPTYVPTEEPTYVPTEEPTYVPTEEPTYVPTEEPTYVPTEEPTYVPTEEPTYVPTEEPTYMPTEEPTYVPSEEPTYMPTEEPTYVPTEATAVAPEAEEP